LIRDIIRDSKGIVLILVLSTVALFTAMILTFSSSQSTDIELAYNFRDSLQALYLAEAGVEAARAVLKEDDPDYDSLDEDWAHFSDYASASSALLDGPQFKGSIVDECSKIDINAMVKEDGERNETAINQLKRLFKVLGIEIDDDELDNLMDAIVDWLDPAGDPSGFGGAEDEYYQALDRPYLCKNGPMDTPEEVLLVKGMKKEYFYDTKDNEGIRKGIGNYITVGTGGKININTASKEVLMSLADDIEESSADDIIAHRPYKKPDDAKKEIEAVSSAASQIENMITVKGTRFMVKVKGLMKSGASVDLTAVLERGSGTPRVVYYNID